MNHLSITVGARELVVELDADRAPSLAGALSRASPHSTLAVHCPTAGAEFCVPVPFFHWHENRRPPMPGDVGYASFGNYLCFYYGEMSAADGPTNVIGQLISPSKALEDLGLDLLAHGARRARLTGASTDLPSDDTMALPALPAAAGPWRCSARRLLAASLAQPPEDIRSLCRASLPAMGNLAGRMQAGVLLLAVAEIFMNARSLATAFDASVQPIRASLRAQMGRHARWLEMAGMPATATWLGEAAAAIDREAPAADVLIAGLEDALIACGRLRFWAEAVSPWHRLADMGPDSNWTHPGLLLDHGDLS
ncbi:hypothetical protein [Variovorax sp. PBL-E5]|uniref:hypothetical protein n=1 Tax=Variovorax sp. PBL-E5 TaxID=434014 RepID=UPI0013162229|nr:hypothetical protein [Variovorax sp. PBL-E5]VTU30205.1 hypothetical protein E5CHR_02968 [Variovorax sp. PBL-E5]